jgi:hypothetical protein
MQTYELFIYAFIRHIFKSFYKNMQTDSISTNFIQEYVSITSSKMSTFLFVELQLLTCNTVYVNWV